MIFEQCVDFDEEAGTARIIVNNDGVSSLITITQYGTVDENEDGVIDGDIFSSYRDRPSK